MKKAAFLAPREMIAQVYGNGRREQIASQVDLLAEVITGEELEEQISRLYDVEILFSTWGMPRLTEEQLDRLPHLKVVFYAAGSVQPFAQPLLDRGILLVSAWRANALPVAEFTLAQILLTNKGYFRNQREFQGGNDSAGQAFRGPGNYGAVVALLGAGSIGRALIKLLSPFRLSVLVYDPFLDDAAAEALSVEKVTLTEAFEQAFVVSNHLPVKPETREIVNARLFSRLRLGATFINTGRGQTVNHSDLLDVFTRRSDLTALLDVTDPEPLPASSPLLALPNVHVSTHIAGSINQEVHRMADYCIAEMDRYLQGKPLHHAVTLEILPSLA